MKVGEDGPLLRLEREKKESIGSNEPNITVSLSETPPEPIFYKL
jgi:hypothetical protein